MALDEDLLLCDLAETYGIYEIERFKPSYIGILTKGLRPDSRIRMKEEGTEATRMEIMSAVTADKLANLVWMLSDDGRRGKNRPEMLTPIITGMQPEEKREHMTFHTPEEFERELKAYTEAKNE